VGLAIGEAGLKKRSPALASATLMIGANLPDVDGFVYLLRPAAALGFRRGWTHGILAMALWPPLLALVMLGIGRLLARRSNTSPSFASPSFASPSFASPSFASPSFASLLLLSALSVWSHPLLDLMNVYGVRLLMPFSEHWFYADALFIVDPWILIALTVGITWSRRAASALPMRFILGGIGIYIAAMAAIGLAGRASVRSYFASRHPGRMMVAPVAANPLRRQVVVQLDSAAGAARQYAEADLAWRGTGFALNVLRFVSPNDTALAVRRAMASPRAQPYLRWARFPFFTMGPEDDCAAGYVCLHDLRYDAPWAEVAVPVARTLSSALPTHAVEQP
jgi:inner membrane protein